MGEAHRKNKARAAVQQHLCDYDITARCMQIYMYMKQAEMVRCVHRQADVGHRPQAAYWDNAFHRCNPVEANDAMNGHGGRVELNG